MATSAVDDPKQRKAYVVTGPSSGIGRCTALELAKHGPVVLVGRAPKKLAEVQQLIEAEGGRAVSVVCDLAEPASVWAAAAQIPALNLPIAGLRGARPEAPGSRRRRDAGFLVDGAHLR
jgi:NAD(P)-dependent dehydrogenase (short-subunit alcohol dehydrogenase family)